MTKHKKSHYLDKIEQLEPEYNKHLQKLCDAEKAGGYTSSIERELKAWKDKKDQYKRRAQCL
ncbi:MAG TPA: hypothetical protein VKM55_24560 [Candidatus Lokiarchaeia archaeon]|nr:hypothetical protein [Candidatus Lokiarchaeia archaeon]